MKTLSAGYSAENNNNNIISLLSIAASNTNYDVLQYVFLWINIFFSRFLVCVHFATKQQEKQQK